ncbi:DinB family protein [Halobacillus trueperi]|uniref:DinB family protein n=1 Tax=Halobacillus trueperi TaxID=156205 RepID=A0A3E0J895_9BACI|nr:DinB family protein [Halobacillus trueperi]REJ09009.1 DinB family protein [Halobacillus trueperi]
MKEESLFQQMRFVRKRSLAALDVTTEEVADAKPEGFLNNIRWNFGHIFVSQENLLARFTGEEAHMPEGYIHRLIQTYQGRLSEEGESPLTLVGESFFERWMKC